MNRLVQSCRPLASALFGALLGSMLLGAATSPARPEISVHVQGETSAEFRLYPDEASPGRDVEVDLTAQLELRAQDTRGWRALVMPRLQTDPADPAHLLWIPRQAWVEYRRGGFATRVGRQVLAWGSADIYRPVDVLSSLDLQRDAPRLERKGDWMLGATYSRPSYGIEAVYLPILEGIDFPSAHSPWSMESILDRLDNTSDVIGLIDDPFLPTSATEHSFGARSRITFGNTDLFLIGYTGIDRLPLLLVLGECRPGPDCFPLVYRTRAIYLPMHLVGLEIQTVVDEVLVKLEAAFRDQTITDRRFARLLQDFDEHSLQVVLGLDYLRQGVMGSPHDLGLVVEFLFDDSGNAEDYLSFRPFQRDVAARLVWSFNDFDRTVIEAGWIQDLERAESFGTLRLKRRLEERVTLELGADMILGPNPSTEDERGNPFYLYSPNDRLVARLVYGF